MVALSPVLTLDARPFPLASVHRPVSTDDFRGYTAGAVIEWSRVDTGHILPDDASSNPIAGIEYRWAMGDQRMTVAQARRAEVRRPHAPLVYHDGNFGSTIAALTEESAR